MSHCFDCKYLCFDELYDIETDEEYDMSYCKIGKKIYGYNTEACDEFEYIEYNKEHK